MLSIAQIRAVLEPDQSLESLLLELLPLASELARPPISNFHVGVAVLAESGNIYLGANQEYQSGVLGFSTHAEQAAVMNAVAHGERGLQLLATSKAPCGHCRQFLNELPTGSALRVITPDWSETLGTLLPKSFGPSDLEIQDRIMAVQSHRLTLDGEIDDVVAAALQAANTSYAPYSGSFSGVAIATQDGKIFCGSYAENAAFNPSMPPLQAALASLVINGGRRYDEIFRVALVERKEAQVRQAETAAALLRLITSVSLEVRYAQLPQS